MAADVYNLPGHVGRGGWTWYTGSCGWMYRAWLEGVLGFDRQGDKLVMNPSLPTDWKTCRLTYKHGSATFAIEIDNAAGVENGVAEVEMDGEILPSVEIPLKDDVAVQSSLKITAGLFAHAALQLTCTHSSAVQPCACEANIGQVATAE